MKTDYPSITVEPSGQVVTIRINHPKKPGGHMHWDLGEVFSDLRGEDSVRVIVLTGQVDGVFSLGPTTAEYDARVLDNSTGNSRPR